ncbi:MAG: serine hydrolase, partial [Gammaproteobacteria bacterium]
MKTLLRLIKYLFTLLFLMVAGGFAVMYYLDPVVTTRLVQAPFSGIPGPRERVPGGTPVDIPAATAPGISAAALDQAVAYGRETGSHALLVYRDDGIELEHYYPGHDADSITPTQSMHKSVLAMLVGIAIEEGHIGSVDDPAANYLDEWANDERAGITSRHM